MIDDKVLQPHKSMNVTQEVLDYLAQNYPNSNLYTELVDKDIWINMWGDGEYSLSYNSIKNPETFLTEPAKDELVKVMSELYPNSFWGDLVDVDACDKVTASFDGTSGKNTVTFNSAEEIYAVINDDLQDLYCIDEEMYLFNYNAAGSIAYYYLDMEELMELANEAKETDQEYICGLLGPGGYIVDTDNYSEEEDITGDEDVTEILDFLEDLVGKEFLYANVNDLV